MNLLLAGAIGWLVGQAIAIGILLEVYKLAGWQSRVSMLCAVIVVAATAARFFS